MIRYTICFIILLVLLNACSNTKYLAPSQKLYTGSKVIISDTDNNVTPKDAKAMSSDLNGLLRPRPNSTLLGMRVKLYIYNKTKTTKKKGFKHWLNTKFGEPPVLISEVDIDKNSDILESRLQNQGYLQADVISDTLSKGKIAQAIYKAKPGPNYTIRKFIFPTQKDPLDTAIAGTAKQTLFKIGDNYNLDIIKNERTRIDARLKEEGFYYFSPDDIIMRVDSSIVKHQVDIYVRVKPTTPDQARRIYTINNIYVYPHYTLRDTALKLDSAVKYAWYYIIDTKKTYKPFTFKNSVLLQPGDVYNRANHNKSLNRFINLGPFKFIKNKFEDVSADTSKLNVYYFLTPSPKKSLQFELSEHISSANYVGTQLSINWLNRNIFKGAESLTISLFGSTETQFSGQNNGNDILQTGLKGKLSFPRFISPWYFKTSNAYIPRTNVGAGYTLIYRPSLYVLNSYDASYGYSWRQTNRISHELNLIRVIRVDTANVTQRYKDSIKNTGNPTLKHVIDAQFVIGPTYSYTNTNTAESYRTNTFYYNGTVGLSGNILGLLSGADTLHGNVKKLFGVPFNQFVKLESEVRYFHKLTPKSIVAARLFAGSGFSYGNSTIMPYSQQYFAGGTNSLRGFRARSIGPGSFYPGPQVTGSSGFQPDESGDIRLEANLEYRPKLFSIVYGALFADAGNVWNLRPHAGLPGGAFGKNFLSQVAVDVGFGLRFDITVLILRTDLGIPILKPFEGEKLHFDFGARVFNLAIGYPF